jgi:hypothetical protein
MYWDKAVKQVGRIRGVVDIDPTGKDEPKIWFNNEDPSVLNDADLIDAAKKRLEACFPVNDKEFHKTRHRVFVLDELTETDFRKTSPGGMFTSKMYFDVDRYQPSSTAHLAATLQTKTWAEYGR